MGCKQTSIAKHISGLFISWGPQAHVRDESPFATVPVRQHIGAIVAYNGHPDNVEYKKWLTENRSRPLLSQAVEDGFCRGVKDEDKAMHQERGDDRCFATLLNKNILGGVHDHTELGYAWVCAVRNPQVPPEVYAQSDAKAKETCDFSDIKGPKRIPDWPHFTAATEVKPVAQMSFLAACKAGDVQPQDVRTLAYCNLMKAGRVAFRRRGCLQWYLSLGTVGDTFAVGIPLAAHDLPTPGRQAWHFDLAGAETQHFEAFVWDPEDWEAAYCNWEPPIVTHIREGGNVGPLHELKLFVVAEGPPTSLMRMAALQAFFDLGVTALKEMYKDLASI